MREKGRTLVADNIWPKCYDGRNWGNKNSELSFKLLAIHLGSSMCDCEHPNQSSWVWKLICLPLYSPLPLNAMKYLCLASYECNLNCLCFWVAAENHCHKCTLQGQNDIVLRTNLTLNHTSRISPPVTSQLQGLIWTDLMGWLWVREWTFVVLILTMKKDLVLSRHGFSLRDPNTI